MENRGSIVITGSGHEGRNKELNANEWKRDKSVSRETCPLESRLAKVELSLTDQMEVIEEHSVSIERLDSEDQESYGRMQGLLNCVMDDMNSRFEGLKDSLMSQILALQEEIQEIKADWSLCKMAVTQGGVGGHSSSNIVVLKPKTYAGSRNARELNNFLRTMEQYFDALNIVDEAMKVKTAPLYLVDSAMVWWRRRYADKECGGLCVINNWTDFKREIKAQFYPQNAEYESRAKLRRLAHKGTVREYVREFSELILDIPDMSAKDSLFFFIDGLQQWAKLELQRRNVQDLASAMAVAKSLIEYKKPEKATSSLSTSKVNRSRKEIRGGDNRSEGKGRLFQLSYDFRPKHYVNGSKDGEKPRISCFLCEGPHKAFECPKRSKLSAMINQERDARDP